MKSKQEEFEMEICEALRKFPTSSNKELMDILEYEGSSSEFLEEYKKVTDKNFVESQAKLNMDTLGFKEAAFCLIKIKLVNAEPWELNMEEDSTFFSLERILSMIIGNSEDALTSYIAKIYGKSHSYIESSVEGFLGTPSGQSVESIELIPIRYTLQESDGQSISIKPIDNGLLPEHYDALNYE